MSSTTRSVHSPKMPDKWAASIEGWSLVSIAGVAGRFLSVVALFLVAGVVGLALYGFTHDDRVFEGVDVSGVEIGGMTSAEARSTIDREFVTYLDQPILLAHNGETFPVVPSAVGVTLNVDATISEAMAFGRDGSIWNRTQTWARSLLRGKSIPAVLSVNDAKLDRALIRIAPSVAVPPANAYIQMDTDSEPAIVSEVPGVAFDLGATKYVLLDQVARMGDSSIAIVAPPVTPKIGGADLAPQLAEVQSAVGSTLMLSGAGRYWAVGSGDLKRIVSSSGPGAPVVVNEDAVRLFVRGIADEIEHAPIDARLVVNDSGELEVVPGAASIDVNVNSSVKTIVNALTSGTHDVALTIKSAPAAISDQQAQDARLRAEQLVADGLQITWKDGSAQFARSELIAAITIESRPGEAEPIAVGFSPIVVANLLGPIVEQINIEASNGRYRFVDNAVKLVEKGSNGQTVDMDKSTDTIISAIMDGKEGAALTVKTVKPKFSNTSAKKIQVNDVLGMASTYYGNSSDARRKNVERAVELENGWLVAPGDLFSYWENIGQVDEKHGFVTGLGILSDGAGGITTAPVVGGGICQVSTTIFQSAFWSGLEIVERTAHPYWLQSYGQPPSGMKGLDAMVDIVDDQTASLDLKFRNTTGNWIAVVMTADGENVRSEIRGTSQGWNVVVQGDGPTIDKLVDPPTETMYQDSPELPAGEEKQVETAQQGFNATVVRIVRDKDGNVIDQYTITSTYVPSVNRILRGTG